MTDAIPMLSVVVPLYNSARTLPRLLDELCALSVEGGLELVLVNDGSRDETDEVAPALVARCAVPVTYLSLERNFGEHSAVLEGIRASRGSFVVTMDDDLQNPPSEVPRLLRLAREEGRDVVYSVFERKQHALWRNLGSRLANLVADRTLDKPRGLYLSSFRCISRSVADEITKVVQPHPYVDALVLRVTENVGVVRVGHEPRRDGKSGYTLRKLIRLWLSMLGSSSTVVSARNSSRTRSIVRSRIDHRPRPDGAA
jgi:undecaprenyl-phosphate 4-deoxy-4-formamido-L-arabinose transferase